MPYYFKFYPAVAAVLSTLVCSCDFKVTKRSAKDSATLYNTELGMLPRDVRSYRNENRIIERLKKDRQQYQTEFEDDGNDDLQMVTIDLSALRPSLPGLVLHRYGELAPKLVQIDLDALNPLLQPHIIWPQFQQQLGDLEETYFDFVKENTDLDETIPQLTDESSLIPTPNQKFAKMTAMEPDWPNLKDLADGDIYDFMPDSYRNEEMMILQQSLPLADEVIVPLDWEDEEPKLHKETLSKIDKGKRNVFTSQSWKPGGYSLHKNTEKTDKPKTKIIHQGLPPNVNFRQVFGSNNWRPGKRRNPHNINKNIEREGFEDPTLKGPRRQKVTIKNIDGNNNHHMNNPNLWNHESAAKGKVSGKKPYRTDDSSTVKISSQESWIPPKQQWRIPTLFATY